MKALHTVCVIGCATLSISHGAFAQEKYPTKSVTVIVPQAAGGGNDAIARIVGYKLSEVIGQQVVIDNRPGAGGNIGAAVVSRATPDGYTLCLLSSSFTTNAAIQLNLPFDPVNGFTPAAEANSAPERWFDDPAPPLP